MRLACAGTALFSEWSSLGENAAIFKTLGIVGGGADGGADGG